MAVSNRERESAEQLEVDLREAWAALQGFDLAYQPQVNLHKERVTGFEALLRWQHPVRGNVSPSDFIPVAEKAGLIDDIGQWVLERACPEAATWPGQVTLAVNVSVKQLENAAFPAIVAAALKKSGLPPSSLELEITETVVLLGDSATLDVLHTIQDTGVRIVMDDFDLGYSSLGYLLQFRFDKLKLDRLFIDGITGVRDRHGTARAIVRAISNLCNDLNMTFLAEGVETEEQLRFLIEVECTELQGFIFGPPLPADSITGFLKSAADLLRRLNGTGQKKEVVGGWMPSVTIPFHQITEATNDIIMVTTPELDPPGPRIIYVNPAFFRLTGYSNSEIIGQTPRILQGPGTNRATLDRVGVALRAGRPVHEKVLNFAKSGAPYWLDLNIVALRDAHGTVTHFAAIERDVTMDKRRLDELERLADRDTLTGIPNRRAFFRAIGSEIESTAATGILESNPKGPCLAFIDADHFKLVNDERGHVVGDAVLCGLADLLTENIRRLDVLGRIGGEEFGVCMPEITLQEGRILAERLRHTVAGAHIATPKGPVSMTVSIGVACFSPGDSITTLADRADAAMYAAKRAGRNRVRSGISKSRD